MNPVQRLGAYGQSVWLDYIRRNLLTSGELEKLISEDGLKGLTSNPTIFEKAIGGSNDYAAALKALTIQQAKDAFVAYEHLAFEDIKRAADLMAPVFQATERRDGYVSLEVSPHLAYDTQGTCEEARRLWKVLGRDNVMIKVPATPQGIPAIETLLSEGINVNATLLFSKEVYEQVAQAYIHGLERFAEAGGELGRLASVASFFISRIDTAIDELVGERLDDTQSGEQYVLLQSIRGQVAIANAKLAYLRYQEIFRSERWQALADKGARTQRLLWASTSIKNPAYRDVRYVEELIGPDTVNTMPPTTLDAFRDHGRPRASLQEDLEIAQDILDTVQQLGISMAEVTGRLLEDGVRLFAQAFDKLLEVVATAREAANQGKATRLQYGLPAPLASEVNVVLQDWERQDKVRRLWARDASLWTNSDEGQWLDWLAVTQDQLAHLSDLHRIARAVEGKYFKDIVLLGMGGSSLAPEVMRMTFGTPENYPQLHVLDSTDPGQIKALEDKIDLAHTAFIVSSKSGSTLEPNILKQYFFAKASDVLGPKTAGHHFVAITDPGSKLQHIAEGDGFRQVFYGLPGIGGRYSALSNFGMIPAAAMGVDIADFLDRANEMVEACAACVPASDNPGVILGIILGLSANHGRDKVTIILSPDIASLGAWLEQLLAESTGKQGKGLIPVDGEALGPPEIYDDDRLFVYLRLATAPDADQDAAVAQLEQAGHAVVRISITDLYDLGQEFFRWEIATAVAGSILDINPFNQPDVEASKVAAHRLAAEYEIRGALPGESALTEDDSFKLYTDEHNAAALLEIAGARTSVADYIKAHLNRLWTGDYFALLAYLARNQAHQSTLQAIRHQVRDSFKVATCLGFGPRFLHSTGQAYKGGPDTGVFLQITCDDAIDLPVPGQRYTFGVIKATQARGDFQVMAERGRRALRIHLGKDTLAGLRQLRELMAFVIKQN